MTRIVAIVVVALLLVAGGIWLARPDPALAPADAPAPSTDAAAGDPATDAPADAPAGADADAAGAETDPGIPEGFAALETRPERRTAFEAAEATLDTGVDYQALIETTAGTLRVDLYEDRAPVTVNNFVFLALNRYYDGIVFHRVLDDFMAQTGDPTGTGRGGPGYTFDDEIVEGLTHDAAGTLSMANAGPNTNGSQFFLTFGPTPWLDGRHAVFGRVIEGLEVLDRIERIDPGQPSAVVALDDTLGDLAAQGFELDGPADRTVRAQLESELGAVPAVGQSFTLDGVTGVIGRVGDQPAAGFFPIPDAIERVTILARGGDAALPTPLATATGGRP